MGPGGYGVVVVKLCITRAYVLSLVAHCDCAVTQPTAYARPDASSQSRTIPCRRPPGPWNVNSNSAHLTAHATGSRPIF